MRIILAVLITVGVTAACAGAAVTRTLIAHNGDRIEAPKIFCFVRSNAITCRPRDRLVVSTKTNDAGVRLMVRGVAVYACRSDGNCYKP